MDNNTIADAKNRSQKEREVQLNKVYKLMDAGVLVYDPQRLDIRGNLVCGNGVVIDVNVIFEGDVLLEDGVIIGANCILINSKIGKGTHIKPFSLLEESVVGEHSFVGPYGRLRPVTRIGNNVQIGNFVEIKNANIASECKINHHSFIGDADLAENVTMGAGTITCNHDGIAVHRTIIEYGAYIGSGCNLIAPLKINASSTIASGSTITEEVAGDTLTIARSRQVTIENWEGPKSKK